ncbi:class I SAM-dependent methyltransferase [Ectobacillus sp. JY-23]|uniref:class I SAM-dependent methyltransferase n=1 Tax=Ectobacillus sp. JY-23 TaxID=2933872 RepID=UPI001FF64089|nr:class I SAM-dependent methyltransferase [Ectobacillus sp. JY-23]UOY94099.1 class I SAM-dependent methyltransferase [Ectobacillus sp. JY-23]
MGTEFNQLFDEWAHTYDSFVAGEDDEYKEVFSNYEAILNDVVAKSTGTVLEFGVGTGNLTNKLLEAGHLVYGIEPSKEMRAIAKQKLPKHVSVSEGDFLNFHVPEQVDTIVSTYAFHHLLDEEKNTAVEKYGQMLKKGGKIVFADTIFINQEAFDKTVEEAITKGYHNLAKDLQSEYYTRIPVMETIFTNNGFTVTFTRYNHFVWIMEAVKN